MPSGWNPHTLRLTPLLPRKAEGLKRRYIAVVLVMTLGAALLIACDGPSGEARAGSPTTVPPTATESPRSSSEAVATVIAAASPTAEASASAARPVPTAEPTASTIEPPVATVATAAISTPEPTQSAVPTATPTAVAATTPSATPAAVEVEIRGYGYPYGMEVAAGTTVTWTNRDAVAHDVAGADGSWTSPLLGAGESYSRAFASAGTFAYFCTVHPYMRAAVTVR